MKWKINLKLGTLFAYFAATAAAWSLWGWQGGVIALSVMFLWTEQGE